MSRTVTALYDSRAEAEAARQRLSSALDLERVKIIDQGAEGSSRSGGHGLGNLHLSNEDRHAYGEGIRRGGALLCAEVHSGEDPDKIISLLEESSSVDLDQRQESWRSEGWSPFAATGGASTANTGSQMTGGSAGMGSQTSGSTMGSHSTTGNVVQEEHIPIVEEELRVGKREVTRGGARVRSYIREVPVHEEVTLREEHVHVERRPVNQQTGAAGIAGGGAAGDLLQERTVEMREMAEEAVVQKVAQVREEVVVSKTAEQRTEQIDDTVRRTEVEVDEGRSSSDDRSSSQDRSAFGGFGDGSGSTPRR